MVNQYVFKIVDETTCVLNMLAMDAKLTSPNSSRLRLTRLNDSPYSPKMVGMTRIIIRIA